ncbi:DUF4124 domain-containing protein [Paracidovorax citrulli]|uniref:DUF4124 domain-containing protein n=2 Tax=Paracidovorax citrulli TaxID=80869 RepID=A1TQJ5_PARC0|nr:hypothetical protein [Paracidovorax citrulli]ABM33233.1 hypothetical protein Aave_2661 [Paracidovorax citrulli AAC00-1]ATG92841.1 DUF4124 domain-containing protein [Paracidovorax citrulli]PVY67463.1 hypothetical protein C8E08_4908 [Paracidovorax citrulli]QCX13047.1 hypothetical protein APS58_4362 [Paracidovorax citrulli]REG68377.1 hypothetical protein C8E07_1483 [Paracidovorax citrulli]
MNDSQKPNRRAACLATAALLGLASLGATAQQAVYRCEQGGKVGYSHEPCLGGKVIDATPTQGMDKMSGVSRKGADVQRDEYRKLVDDALRPLTGLSHERMNVERRRLQLSPDDKQQCRMLDGRLPSLEQRAAHATGEARAAADAELHRARREFYWLKC